MDESSFTGDWDEAAVSADTTNAPNTGGAEYVSVLSDCVCAPRERVADVIPPARKTAEPRMPLGYNASACRGASIAAVLHWAREGIAAWRKRYAANAIAKDASPDAGECIDERRGESFVLIYASGRIFRTRELLNGVTELETRAAQLGARVVYDNGSRSGTLQANRYVIARFGAADPLGW